jgi:hypothetical protein
MVASIPEFNLPFISTIVPKMSEVRRIFEVFYVMNFDLHSRDESLGISLVLSAFTSKPNSLSASTTVSVFFFMVLVSTH